MNRNLLAVGALAMALAAPIAAGAQQSQPPHNGGYAQNHAMPSADRMQRHWARRFGRLNLSGDQQQRIQSMINQYSQGHPEGSARDGSYRALRHQIMGVLTPDQQNQFRQQMRARRAQMMQRRGQMQGGQGYAPGQQYGAPDQQYQQGPPPDQRYQQGPPNEQQYGPEGQQYGPPPGQQYGPPGQEYQQGPPPDQQEPNGPPPA